MNNAGRIGFDIKGEYSPTVTYDFLDVVFYQKSSYVAKKLTVGNTPARSDEYWQILAEAEGITADGDISETTVTFTEAANRENVASGETSATLFGKIRKVIKDLKTVAFSGKYSDLSGAPGVMTGATASEVGTSGLVPAPGAGKQKAVLQGGGTWKNLGAAAFMGVANNDATEEEGFLWDARRGKALREDLELLNSAMAEASESFSCVPASGIVTEKNFCFYNPLSRQVHILVSSIEVTGEFKPGNTIFSIPVKYRPKSNMICMATMRNNNNIYVATGTVYASGILAQNITSSGIFNSIMFVADYYI